MKYNVYLHFFSSATPQVLNFDTWNMIRIWSLIWSMKYWASSSSWNSSNTSAYAKCMRRRLQIPLEPHESSSNLTWRCGDLFFCFFWWSYCFWKILTRRSCFSYISFFKCFLLSSVVSFLLFLFLLFLIIFLVFRLAAFSFILFFSAFFLQSTRPA